MSDWTKAKHSKDLGDEDFKKIKDIFVSTIELPRDKPERQFLLCPVGLVGAGKSTVLLPLSKKLNLVRISHDEIRKLLKENDFNYDRSKEIAREVASDLLKTGYSIAIDGNCGSPETFNSIKKIERDYQILPVWVQINPPEEFIINKLRNYKHTWLFKNGEEAVRGYHRYKETYGDGTNLGIDFTYTFDTSKPNLDEQIDEAETIILKKVQSK